MGLMLPSLNHAVIYYHKMGHGVTMIDTSASKYCTPVKKKKTNYAYIEVSMQELLGF